MALSNTTQIVLAVLIPSITFIAVATTIYLTLNKSVVGLEYVNNTRNNLDAPRPPSNTDDAREGYDRGAFWIDTPNEDVYVMIDATQEAAAWKKINVDDHLNDFNNPHQTTANQVGLPIFRTNASTAPTATDDADDGYSEGSVWIDTTNNEAYICVDSTIGAAVWQEVSTEGELDAHIANVANPHAVTKAQVGLGNVENILSNYSAAVAPTINDDADDGYTVGSHWFDTTADEAYVCVDSTVGAAVWREISTEEELNTHIADSSNPHAVTKAQVGLGNVENILSNYSAAVAPTVNDDADDGYAVGSHWFDTTADEAYVCVDSTVGAAVWREISTEEELNTHIADTSNPHSVTKAQVGLGNVENILSNYSAAVAPTVNDDADDGYAVGSHWFDTTNDVVYVCIDSTVGAAIWNTAAEKITNPLIVGDTANATATVQMYATDTTLVQFGNSTSNTIGALQYDLANNDFSVFTNGSRKLTVDAIGNVGINVTGNEPSSKLTIGGTNSEEAGVTICTYSNANLANSAFLNFLETNAGSPPTIFGEANAFGFRFQYDGDTNLFGLRSCTGATAREILRFNRSQSTMTVGAYPSGSAPTSTFHVYDDSSTTGNGVGILVEQDGTGDAQIQFALTGGQVWTVGTDNSDSDKFRIQNANALSSSSPVTITTAGFVGFNQNTPSCRVHIDSETNAEALRLETSAGLGDPYMSFYGNAATRHGYIQANAGSTKMVYGVENTLVGHRFLTTGGVGALEIQNQSVSIGFASTPGARCHVYDNNATTGAGVGLLVEQDGTGDAQIQFELTGAQIWTAGVDNSDGDSFKIESGSVLGTTAPSLAITTTKRIGINTNLPQSTLHIDGGSTTEVLRLQTSLSGENPYMSFYGNSLIHGFFQASPSSNAMLYSVRNLLDIHRFLNGSNTALEIQNQSVSIGGIGTPQARCHVYDDNATTGNGVGILVEQDGTGDAQIQFALTGGQVWTMGIDNSTTNNDWVLSASNTLGTNNVMSVDNSLSNVTFAFDVSTQNLTVNQNCYLNAIVGVNAVNVNAKAAMLEMDDGGEWLRFRTGGAGTVPNGVMFSRYNTSNFAVYRDVNQSALTFAFNASLATSNVVDTDFTELMSLSSDGDLSVNGSLTLDNGASITELTLNSDTGVDSQITLTDGTKTGRFYFDSSVGYLDVYTNTNTLAARFSQTQGFNTYGTQCVFGSTTTSGFFILQLQSVAGSGQSLIFSDGGAAGGQISYSHSTEAMTFNANGTSAMIIDSNQNVGIGTSPGARCHVYDNNATTGAGVGLLVEQDGTGDAQIQFEITGAQIWTVGVDNSVADDFAICSGSTLGSNEKLRIEATGDFGFNLSTTNVVPRYCFKMGNNSGSSSKMHLIGDGSSETIGSVLLSKVPQMLVFNGEASIGNDPAAIGLMTTTYGPTAFPSTLMFGTTRADSGNITSHAGNNLLSGDITGFLDFCGCDGSDNRTVGARVKVSVSDTTSTNIIPSQIELQTMNSSGTLATGLTVNKDGNVDIAGDLSAANLASGTYTPTIAGTLNVDAANSSVVSASYHRVLDHVTVSSEINVKPAGNVNTMRYTLTLPITNNNFSGSNKAIGSCNAYEIGNATNFAHTAVQSSTGSQLANFYVIELPGNVDTTKTVNVRGTFMYEIV